MFFGYFAFINFIISGFILIFSSYYFGHKKYGVIFIHTPYYTPSHYFHFVFISLLFFSFYLYAFIYSMPDLQGSVLILDVKHDTEPNVNVARPVYSIVTVTVRNWVAVPVVTEATTTKDGIVSYCIFGISIR